MATNFSPKVGRIFIDADAYPSGTSTNPTYQGPKLEDIGEALVNTGEGWEIHHTDYNTNYANVWLRRVSGDTAQIILHFNSNHGYINANNKYSQNSADDRMWILYKPSTTGIVIPTSKNQYSHADFCSAANSFKFSPIPYSATFHNYDLRFTWLVEGERVILLVERPLHHAYSFAAMGPDIISTYYNTGTAKWGGGGDIVHPQPDTYPELFMVRYYDSMTPGQDQPNSLQWYKTDGSWNGTYGNGVAIRGEWIQNVTPNGVEPYLREPLVIYKNEYGAVWPDTGGATGNGLKGLVDMDFISAVNAGPGAENLNQFQRLESSNFLHVSDGLCVGWDNTFGPYPT